MWNYATCGATYILHSQEMFNIYIQKKNNWKAKIDLEQKLKFKIS